MAGRRSMTQYMGHTSLSKLRGVCMCSLLYHTCTVYDNNLLPGFECL